MFTNQDQAESSVTEGIEDGEKAASPGSIALIKERLNFFIEDFQGKRDESRLWTNGMRAASIVLGAAVTILLGVKSSYQKQSYSELLTVLTLILSTSVTALSSWESFSRHPGKWLRYRSTLSLLYTIKDQLLYKESLGLIFAKDIEASFSQIMLTVHEANQEWMNLRSPMIGSATQDNRKLN